MVEEFRKWLDLSERDMRTAKYNFDGGIFDASIFYAQQSVEKAFKAILIKKTKSFPRIHDLTRLARLVDAPKNIIEFCSRINPGYILSRYPDQEGDYGKKDAEDIIKFSEEVLKWIKETF